MLHTKYQGSIGPVDPDKKIFSWSLYISLCKTCGYRDGTRGITWTNLVEVHGLMIQYIPSIKALGLQDFLSFLFWLSWQPEFCMEFKYLNNFERESGEIPQSSLRGGVVWSRLFTDGQMTNRWRWTSEDHKSSYWFHGSGKLKQAESRGSVSRLLDWGSRGC